MSDFRREPGYQPPYFKPAGEPLPGCEGEPSGKSLWSDPALRWYLRNRLALIAGEETELLAAEDADA